VTANTEREGEDMGRADQYADALTAANEELIAFAESCTDEQWRTVVPGENWTVGVVIHHCALGQDGGTSWLRQILENGNVPGTPEELDAANAAHAVDCADISVAETVALLQRTGSTAADYLRSLTDEELDRSGVLGPAGGGTFTVERLAGVFPRHSLGHLGHAREALAGA
jgi:DinB family protein